MAKLRADFPFIEALDKAFPVQKNITTASVIDYFTPKYLQGHRRAVACLSDQGLMASLDSPEAKCLLAGRRVLVQSATDDTPWIHTCLVGFWAWMKKMGKVYRDRGHRRTLFPLEPLSIGIVLRSARRLLLQAHQSGVSDPVGIQQSQIDKFYVADTASAGNLSKFIQYLNDKTHRFYRLKTGRGTVANHIGPTLTQAQFSALVRQLMKSTAMIDVHWRLCSLLCLLYIQQPHLMFAFKMSHVRVTKADVECKFAQEWVCLDRSVSPLFRAWLNQRRAALKSGRLNGETFLFPSQSPHRAQLIGSLSDWLKTQGVQLRSLFPSALANLYRRNLDNPISATELLGVKRPVALLYAKAFLVGHRRQIVSALAKSHGFQK